MALEGVNNFIREVGQDKASAMLYGAVALFAGRKFCYAGIYKAGAKAAQLIGSKHAAADWNKSGDENFANAKKDFVRDLGVTAGLITAATFVGYASEVLKLDKEAKKAELDAKLAQEKEANKPLQDKVWDHVTENPVLDTYLGVSGSILAYKYLPKVFKSIRHCFCPPKEIERISYSTQYKTKSNW